MLAQIELYNLGATGRIDVSVDYMIKDSNGKDILQEHETLAVETQAKYVKEFQLPADVEFGKYILYVRTNYNGEVASSSVWFNIGRKELSIINIILYTVICILVIGGVIIFIRVGKIKKQLITRKKILGKNIHEIKEVKKRVIKTERQKAKLNIKKGALQRAYKEGHIKKESYRKGIHRLKKSLKK